MRIPFSGSIRFRKFKLAKGVTYMNNVDIETFWTVVENGSVTAAAEALFITRPTLSGRVQSLENEVGAKLFIRGQG